MRRVGDLDSVRARRKLARIIERDGRKCCFCGHRVDMTIKGNSPRAASVEHIVPLIEGGTNALENLALAHRKCNSKDDIERRKAKRRVELWDINGRESFRVGEARDEGDMGVVVKVPKRYGLPVLRYTEPIKKLARGGVSIVEIEPGHPFYFDEVCMDLSRMFALRDAA